MAEKRKGRKSQPTKPSCTDSGLTVSPALSPARSPSNKTPAPSTSQDLILSRSPPLANDASSASRHGQLPPTPQDSSPASSQKDDASTETTSPHEGSLTIPSRFRGHHPPGIWDARKEAIRHLYIDEELPLREVRTAMIQQGFEATEKMYKDKFAKWGFTKNNRRKDVAKMVHVKKQRKVVGKPTEFHRHGKVVDLEAYLKRARLSWDDVLAASDAGELPDYLRPRTPPPLGSPRSIRSPDFYHFRDLILRSFRDLKARSQERDGPCPVPWHVKYAGTGFHQAIRTLRDASWLYGEGHSSAALQLSNRAFESLHLIVTDPSEWALHDVLGYQMSWIHFGHHNQLWKYLVDYSELVCGPTPWLREVFVAVDDCLRTYPIQTVFDFLSETLADAQIIILGQSIDGMRLGLQGFLISFGREHYTPPTFKNFFRRSGESLVDKMRVALPADEEMIRAYDIYALCFQTEWDDDSIVDLATTLHNDSQDPFVKRICLRVMYRFHRARWESNPDRSNPRLQLAIAFLKRVIGLSGTSEFQIQREIWEDIKLLESWQLDAGDLRQVSNMRQMRDKSLQTYFAALGLEE